MCFVFEGDKFFAIPVGQDHFVYDLGRAYMPCRGLVFSAEHFRNIPQRVKKNPHIGGKIRPLDAHLLYEHGPVVETALIAVIILRQAVVIIVPVLHVPLGHFPVPFI